MSVDNIRVLIAVAADAIPQTWSSIPLLEGAKMSLTVHLEPVLVIFKSRFAIRSKRQPKDTRPHPRDWCIDPAQYHRSFK